MSNKVMISFSAQEEFRDEILEMSKKENVQFERFIRKVLKQYIHEKTNI